MEMKYIIIFVVAVIVLIISVSAMISKKKKNDNSNEPIHKEYDESIASIVENLQEKNADKIANNPPLPVEEEKIDKNFVLEINEGQEPKADFSNIGMVAEPIVEIEPKQPEVVNLPEPPKVEVQEIHEIKPEIAETSQGQFMQDYEIKPQTNDVAPSDIINITPQEVKQEPMFVYDVPNHEVNNELPPKPIEIQIDVPDMEEIK